MYFLIMKVIYITFRILADMNVHSTIETSSRRKTNPMPINSALPLFLEAAHRHSGINFCLIRLIFYEFAYPRQFD